MRTHVKADGVDVAAAVDAILSEVEGVDLPSEASLVALIRQRTRTERSDADLKALIAKKAAVLGVAAGSKENS
jgi:hypothetical protein